MGTRYKFTMSQTERKADDVATVGTRREARSMPGNSEVYDLQ